MDLARRRTRLLLVFEEGDRAIPSRFLAGGDGGGRTRSRQDGGSRPHPNQHRAQMLSLGTRNGQDLKPLPLVVPPSNWALPTGICPMHDGEIPLNTAESG